MKTRILAILAITSTSLGMTGCSKIDDTASAPPAASVAAAPAAAPLAPPVAPVAEAPAPAAAPALAAAPAAPGQLTVQGFAASVPAGWVPAQPSSSMRVAQFSLPALLGGEGAEVAAFFFPTGQGGSHEANIERWASQFAGPDGKPGKPELSVRKLADSEVSLVELKGTYARGVGMGPTGDAKPGQTLMIAMVETAAGRITLQMYGPSKAVAAQRENFIRLATGFRRA